MADGPVIRRGFQSQETLLPECTVNDQSALKQMLCAHVAEVGPERAWLIAWCDHVVLVGDVTAELAHTLEPIEPRYLHSLRPFGLQGELWLWRQEGGFCGRLRCDGVGTAGTVMEDRQSLWGTRTQAIDNGWVRVTEGRGTAFAVPFSVNDDDLPLCLRLRHYLTADDDGLVGTVDSRLVALETWDGRKLAKERIHGSSR